MSTFFIFNNLHFALELLGAIAFLTVAWLAFDSLKVRRDFTAASRAVGFSFLVLWQVIHAFGITGDSYNYLGYAFYFLGLFFIILNLLFERPIERPEFKGILVLPGLSAVLLPFNSVVAFCFFIVAFLSFRQYKREIKKSLLPFTLAFFLLFLGALMSLFYPADSLGLKWMVAHIFELAGFLALTWWVWSYLQLRVREEMLLIFVSLTLFMAVIVSLTFSTILFNSVEKQTKDNLLINTRVLDFAIAGLQEEALAKAKFLAKQTDIREALLENDFEKLDELLASSITQEKLGFLTLLDGEGEVVLRAHMLSEKGENLSSEKAAGEALKGESFVTIEPNRVEKLSIRAASPIIKEGEIVGAIVAGFQLDNTLVDRIKKISGLEMSIFENDKRVATTIFNTDGRTRSVGVKQTDPKVLNKVLKDGGEITLRTTILSRPFFGSYLPIIGSDNRVIGMISAAQPQAEIFQTTQSTNRLTLVVVIVIMLVLVAPIYFITRRLGEEIK